MKRRIISIASAISLLVLLIPANTVQALPDYVTNYDVYYNCVCGPCWSELEGQWVLDCDGSFTGWGWEPGHGCSDTTVTYGAPCSTCTALPCE